MMDVLQKELLEIETILAERTANILSQLVGQNTMITVAKVVDASVKEVVSLVGSPALAVQLSWKNGPAKFTVLANKDVLPDITSLITSGREGESQALSEMKEGISYIFADKSEYLAERTGQAIQFGPPELQLLEIKEDKLFANSIVSVLSVQVGEDISTQICKIFPITVAEQMQASSKVQDVEQEQDHYQNRINPIVATPGHFEELHDTGRISVSRNLDTLLDLSLPVAVELGRTKMLLKDILELGPGGIIELNKFSGEPVDLFVNTKKFAEGEVVVIDQNFGVRITTLVSEQERIESLKN